MRLDDNDDLEFLMGIGFWIVLVRLERIEAKIDTLILQEDQMAQDLAPLVAEVTELHTVTDGVLATMDRLADLVEANADDPAALNEVVASIRSDRERLASAVTENTPAAEEPPPEG